MKKLLTGKAGAVVGSRKRGKDVKRKGVEERATVRWVACPVCQKEIPAARISFHVEKCLKMGAAGPGGSGAYKRVRESASDEAGGVRKKRQARRAARTSSSCLQNTGRNSIFDELRKNARMMASLANARTLNRSLPNGIFILHNFLSAEEESTLVSKLEHTLPNWKVSKWNGFHLVKEWGRKLVYHGHRGRAGVMSRESQCFDIPTFLDPVVQRLVSTCGRLGGFCPNECNANKYIVSEGHFISEHYDDRIMSGELLANISMGSDAYMEYSKGIERQRLLLPQRSLQIVSGEARYNWKHGIPAGCLVGGDRISLTFRCQGKA